MLISAAFPVLLQQSSFTPRPRGLLTLFQATGFFGPLLVLLGASALVLAIRRWLELRPERMAPERLQQSLEAALRDGSWRKGLELAEASGTCLGEVVAAGLQLQAVGLDEMLANVERTAVRESLRYSNRIANIARLGLIILLVGVLGTVMSLVTAISVLEMLKSPTLMDIVYAVGESLICTVLGLSVALFTFIAYFVLESRLVHRTLVVREIAEELMQAAAAKTRTSGA